MSALTIGAVGAGLGAAYKIYSGIKQNNLADKINPNYTAYQESPYAKQSLGLATQMFNGRMPGAAKAEENILGAQANQNANVQRNATDSSTALLLGQAGEAQANQASNDLAIKEGTYKTGLLDNVQNALNQLTGEKHIQHQDMMQKYGIDTADKSALRGAGMTNIAGGVNDFASEALLLNQNGAFKSKGGLGGGFTPQATIPYQRVNNYDPNIQVGGTLPMSNGVFG